MDGLHGVTELGCRLTAPQRRDHPQHQVTRGVPRLLPQLEDDQAPLQTGALSLVSGPGTRRTLGRAMSDPQTSTPSTASTPLVYLDHAATTPMLPEAAAAMTEQL